MRIPPTAKDMTEREKAILNDNTRLVEWVSAIYGIFWGVWLGFFIDNVITNCKSPVSLPKWAQDFITIVYPYFPIALMILTSIYSFFLIKWLWSIRFVLPESSYRVVFPRLGRAFVFWFLTIAGVSLLGYSCTISSLWVWMGVWATLGWLLLICVVILIDRRSW